MATYVRTIDKETKEQMVYPLITERDGQIYDEIEKTSGFINNHIREIVVIPDNEVKKRVVYPVIACRAPINSGVDMYFLGVFSSEKNAKALVEQMQEEYKDDGDYTIYYTRAIID
jgi:hypothetical protein